MSRKDCIKDKVKLIMHGIDNLTGRQFEWYTAFLFKSLGYQFVTVTRRAGDFGVDVMAFAYDTTVGIQCKHLKQGRIGYHAVEETCGGCDFYGIDKGIVLTNKHYTTNASIGATGCGIKLLGRKWLKRAIIKLLKKHKYPYDTKTCLFTNSCFINSLILCDIYSKIVNKNNCILNLLINIQPHHVMDIDKITNFYKQAPQYLVNTPQIKKLYYQYHGINYRTYYPKSSRSNNRSSKNNIIKSAYKTGNINKYISILHKYYTHRAKARTISDHDNIKISRYMLVGKHYIFSHKNILCKLIQRDLIKPKQDYLNKVMYLLFNKNLITRYNQRYNTSHKIGDIKHIIKRPCTRQQEIKAIHYYYQNKKTMRMDTISVLYRITKTPDVIKGINNIKHNSKLSNNIPYKNKLGNYQNFNYLYYLICNPDIIDLYNQSYNTHHKVGAIFNRIKASINTDLNAMHTYYTSTTKIGTISTEHSVNRNKYVFNGKHNLYSNKELLIKLIRNHIFDTNRRDDGRNNLLYLMFDKHTMYLYNQKYHTNHKVGDIDRGTYNISKVLDNIIKMIHKYYSKYHTLNIRTKSDYPSKSKYVIDGLQNLKHNKQLIDKMPSYTSKTSRYIYYLLCNPTVMSIYNKRYNTRHQLGDITKEDKDITRNIIKKDIKAIHLYYNTPKAFSIIRIRQHIKCRNNCYVLGGKKYLNNHIKPHKIQYLINHTRLVNLNVMYLFYDRCIMRKYNQFYNTNHKVGDIKKCCTRQSINCMRCKEIKALHKYYHNYYSPRLSINAYKIPMTIDIEQGKSYMLKHKIINNNEKVNKLYCLVYNPKVIRKYNAYYHTNRKVGNITRPNHSNHQIVIKEIKSIHMYYVKQYTVSSIISRNKIKKSIDVMMGRNYILKHPTLANNKLFKSHKRSKYLYDLICNPYIMHLYNNYYNTTHKIGTMINN